MKELAKDHISQATGGKESSGYLYLEILGIAARKKYSNMAGQARFLPAFRVGIQG